MAYSRKTTLKWIRKYETQLDKLLDNGGGIIKGWPPARYFLQHPKRKQLFNIEPVKKDCFYVGLKKPMKKIDQSRRYAYYKISSKKWRDLI